MATQQKANFDPQNKFQSYKENLKLNQTLLLLS